MLLVEGAATAGAILLVWKFPNGTVPVPLLVGMVLSATLLQPVCWLRVACLQILRTAGVVPPAGDFRRREEGPLAKGGIFGYRCLSGYASSPKKHGRILP